MIFTESYIHPLCTDPAKYSLHMYTHLFISRVCDPIAKVHTRHILIISHFLQITDRYDNHKYKLLKLWNVMVVFPT